MQSAMRSIVHAANQGDFRYKLLSVFLIFLYCKRFAITHLFVQDCSSSQSSACNQRLSCVCIFPATQFSTYLAVSKFYWYRACSGWFGSCTNLQRWWVSLKFTFQMLMVWLHSQMLAAGRTWNLLSQTSLDTDLFLCRFSCFFHFFFSLEAICFTSTCF